LHHALDERIIWHEASSEEAAIEATASVLRLAGPPTALLTGQNLVTIGASRALRAIGMQDATGMAKLAAEILFRRLDGDRSPVTTHVLPTRLITRGSGEIRPAAARA
jgi:LacI family transcriptional regulator